MKNYSSLNINNPFENADSYFIEETESTMEEARKIASLDCVSGTTISTSFQSKGRGRVENRVWESIKSENLLFTLILKNKDIVIERTLLPLLTGYSLSKVIDLYSGRNSFIKWPNDILIEDKKISGILCEADKNYTYIGIGINCNQIVFSDEIKDKSTSLKLCIGQDFHTDNILEAFLNEFKSDLSKNNDIINNITNKLYKLNKNISFLKGDPRCPKIRQGILMGLSESGLIQIKSSDNSLREYLSGEIFF